MSISETASKNHEKLLPNHESRLKVTDPELIEVFDNFAFDEVISHGNLDDKTRLMVILATLIASQTLSEFRVMLGAKGNLWPDDRQDAQGVAGRPEAHPEIPYRQLFWRLLHQEGTGDQSA